MTEVAAGATHELRRRILREGRGDADVHFPEDDAAGVFHLAAVEDGLIKGVVTVLPVATPRRPGRRAWRIRGMAVDGGHQRAGVGTRLLDAVTVRARAAGIEVLWAHGRDTALGFYESRGWAVEGDGYLSEGIPHHTVVVDLGPVPSG